MRLATNRIRIIPKEQVHTNFIYKWFHSGEYEDFFGNREMLNFDESLNFDEGGKKVFMIVDNVNPSIVYGMCILSMIHDRNRNLCFSILVDNQFHRSKLGTEATKLVVYYTMNMMNMFKVWSLINSHNIASIKGCESIGFVNEGCLKQHNYNNGEFSDVLIYSITKGPFNKRYKQKLELSEKEVIG